MILGKRGEGLISDIRYPMSDKRGELTTQQIVLLIILIASFAVLVYFLVSLGLGNQTKQDVCHNSVVARSTAVTSEAVPLDCQRSYVCITKDGTCESMTKPIIKKVSNQEEVYSVLSDEMANCWWVYGEGKINYVGKDYFENLYCSICSQIAFDDSAYSLFEGGKIDKKELYYYMSLTNISNDDKTYLEYLYKTNDVEKILLTTGADVQVGTLDMTKQYYVLTAITSEVSNIGWIATGAAAVGAATLYFVSGPVGWVAGAVIIGATAGGIGGNYVASFVKGDSGNDFISPTLIEVNSKEFDSLQCDEISSAS